MQKIALPIQILIGLVLGLLFALLSVTLGVSPSFTVSYIKPFGTVFLNSMKMIAIPLIFVSLVVGVTSIEDVTKLSRIGGKTFLTYTITTIVAVALGLMIANLVRPGQVISEQTRDRLMTLYTGEAEQHVATAQAIREQGEPLQLFVDLVPDWLLFCWG